MPLRGLGLGLPSEEWWVWDLDIRQAKSILRYGSSWCAAPSSAFPWPLQLTVQWGRTHKRAWSCASVSSLCSSACGRGILSTFAGQVSGCPSAVVLQSMFSLLPGTERSLWRGLRLLQIETGRVGGLPRRQAHWASKIVCPPLRPSAFWKSG